MQIDEVEEPVDAFVESATVTEPEPEPEHEPESAGPSEFDLLCK